MSAKAGPSTDPLAETLRVAVDVAREAGRILVEGWGTRPTVRFKDEDINLVTEYDKRSEALIVERLARAFPQDRVVAEEGSVVEGQGDAGARRVWYVDPLDGTTNFAHGLPLFSVSLGLVVDGRAALGVVEAPVLGWTFAGKIGLDGSGGGSTFNGKPITPSTTDRLSGALLVTGFPYARNPIQDNLAEWAAFTAAAQGTRRLGSAALDLCFVAAGWLDGYWERALHPWDLVAGAAIVEGAGGRATDLDGSPFDGRTGRVLASNAHIHEQMSRILQGVARRSNAPWP
ncbi:MAG TPA: inositol monophosphatase family protein [Polyangia bacterium]|nr:inositol monophosphatase family protein [Polyangia bacterium]